MTKQFDLAEFEAFCLSKGDERYNGISAGTCALAQFGFPDVGKGSLDRLGISDGVYRAVVFHGFDPPADFYTFGSLASRLSRLREK
jgi:hypothetical protein